MIKNTAGQVIGAQMISASDGSAFTGSVTVYVTIDGGTQAIGTVGSGVCTHEGNGYHSYLPSQAETNGDLVAFTFIGTGAVPATIQVPTGPDTVTSALGTSAAGKLALAAAAIITGALSGTPTTGGGDSDLTGYTADQLVGRTIYFTSGAADGEASRITGFTVTGGALTWNTLTIAPSAADTFVIE